MYSKQIEELKDRIEQSRRTIKNTRDNMARMRANKGPKHYQDSGKRNIESEKKQIERYKEKIESYKAKQRKEKQKKAKSMGKGVDSFKRELGKNTGKWVSNKVFGDGHATPHRVNVKTEKQESKSEDRKDILTKGKEFFSEIDENKDEVLKVNSQREEIIATSIPHDKDELMNFANLLLSRIKVNGWKSGENEKHINSLSDACLIKLDQCEMKLSSINAINEAQYIQKEIEKLKKKKFIQKYLLFVAFGLFALVMFILYQLGIVK